jgi:HAMP domain-containing protein
MNQQVIDEIYELEEAIASLISSSNYDTDVVNELRQQIERLKAQINS